MFSACNLCACFLAVFSASAAELRVCADPHNLPFSDSSEHGFENELAAIVARDLGRTLTYYWAPQYARFTKALRQGKCDVIMGVPSGFGPLATTRSYYSSTYVFVSRPDVAVRSFDDSGLRKLRIAVQLPGDDGAALPPAHALRKRGLLANVVWYRLVQTYLTPNSPGRLVEAVAHDEADVAVLWGPIAKFYAARSPVAMRITPVRPSIDGDMPFTFEVAVGVKRGMPDLRRDIDRVIARRHSEIQSILQRYGVPLVKTHPVQKASIR